MAMVFPVPGSYAPVWVRKNSKTKSRKLNFFDNEHLFKLQGKFLRETTCVVVCGKRTNRSALKSHTCPFFSTKFCLFRADHHTCLFSAKLGMQLEHMFMFIAKTIQFFLLFLTRQAHMNLSSHLNFYQVWCK
jgi:hypothetical protein